jgi:hypothetical protein
MDLKGPVPDGKGTGSHHGKIPGKVKFDGVGSRKNPDQGHNPEGNDEHGKDRPEKVSADGI